MNIKVKEGSVVSVSLSVEPWELNEDFGMTLVLKEDMVDLQKRVIDFLEEITIEANQRLRQR